MSLKQVLEEQEGFNHYSLGIGFIIIFLIDWSYMLFLAWIENRSFHQQHQKWG